jgi:hypothetical protein
MKIDKLIAGLFLTAYLSLQAWTLSEVVTLKTSVAALDARLTALAAPGQKASAWTRVDPRANQMVLP